MNWRESRERFRGRLVAKYNELEAKNYDTFVGSLSGTDEEAYLADIQDTSSLAAGQSVLDVGAGSGTLTKILSRIDGLSLTALEPSPSMRGLFRSKEELSSIGLVAGGCDCKSDRDFFAENSFDAIVSRQVVNSLFDPLIAFQNWHHWLKPGGRAIVLDGLYGRDGWTGVWEEEVDVIPLAACQSMATIPYLMESIGFQVKTVNWMHRTNRLPSTRTKRFIVVATKLEH